MTSFEILSPWDVLLVIEKISLKDMLALSFTNKRLHELVNNHYTIALICKSIGIYCYRNKVKSFEDLYKLVNKFDEDEIVRLIILSIENINKDLAWILINYSRINIEPNGKLNDLIYEVVRESNTPTWIIELIFNIVNESDLYDMLADEVGDKVELNWTNMKYSSLKLILPVTIKLRSPYYFLKNITKDTDIKKIKLTIDIIISDREVDMSEISAYFVGERILYKKIGTLYDIDIVESLIDYTENFNNYNLIHRYLLDSEGVDILTDNEIRRLLEYCEYNRFIDYLEDDEIDQYNKIRTEYL